ncbi:MAG: 2-succinyl-6-hydroxy-2,4-cyclohexadiene-1-carboxylate synthase [Bacillaceae bacterium]
MNKKQINGVSYAYTKKGNGPFLLLLHGFTGSKETWEPYLDGFSSHFTVIAVDLIGHGETDAPPDRNRYTMENVVRDLYELIELEEAREVHLLGYSMGGRVAVSFAATYPEMVKSLVLESCTAGIMEQEDRLLRQKSDNELATFIMANSIEAFVSRWESIPLFEPLQKRLTLFQRQTLRLQRLTNDKVGLANSLIGMGTGAQVSYWDKLSSFSFPVLLLCGEEDEKFCRIMKKMKNLLVNANYQKISQASHVIHVEQCQIFGTIVEEFLIANI